MTETKEVAEILEETSQVIEDTLDLMEAKWFTNRTFLITVALGTGVALGSAVTFWVAKKRIEQRANERANAEIEDVKNHYSAIHKPDVSLEELASQYEEAQTAADTAVVEQIIEREGYTPYEKVPPAVEVPASPIVPGAEVIVQESRVVTETVKQELNVFEETGDPNFSYDVELRRREEHPNEPFVLSRDEFDQGEAEYEQAQLTYYDGDDVLADTNDKPVDDVDAVVGFENVLRFGHGSGDPSVVYVRNPKLQLDFEVTHSAGSYAKEVLGFDKGDELQHSDKRRMRKFRASDE